VTDAVVRAAYAARADEYATLFGSMQVAHAVDRDLISGWASSLTGPIIDVGCGPGHWTHYLSELGADVEGLDLVPEFVDLARARFPTVRFRVASAEDLGLPDASVAGILAWYSLIHVEPERLPTVLREFARCTRGDGGLVVGFCAGGRLEEFSHSVTPAHFWPVDQLAERIEDAGYLVDTVQTRADPGQRPHGAIVAHRTGP
jgi:ubiquinone/menaquinone biosynthesis C-methylase UbiE